MKNFLPVPAQIEIRIVVTTKTRLNLTPPPGESSHRLNVQEYIRTGRVLSESNLPFQHFLLLIYYFSSKSLTNVEISAYTGISEKSVGDELF